MGLRKSSQDSTLTESVDEIETVVQKSIQEYMRQANEQEEPALKAKLGDERRKREKLEHQLNELREENRRSRKQAEQVDRYSQIRSALQELGVRKVDLAFKLVQGDIFRGEDGDLYAESDGKPVPYQEYLTEFVSENPEFLPPRIPGGAGAERSGGGEFSSGFDLDRIRPGMSREDSLQAWKEVARLTGHNLNNS